MNLFYLKRLKALPIELRTVFLFSLAANVMMVLEGVTIGIIKFNTITPWIIPWIGVVASVSMLMVDKCSDLPLKTLWKTLNVSHYLSGLSWVAVLLGGDSFIWFVIGFGVFEGVLWTAEMINFRSMLAKEWPAEFKESQRIKTHNLVLPTILAGIVASGALALGNSVAIVAVVISYIPMQYYFQEYRRRLGPAAERWAEDAHNTGN